MYESIWYLWHISIFLLCLFPLFLSSEIIQTIQPTIALIRDHLFEAIGKTYTDEEFDELCFEFGVEVDDIETQVVEFTADGSKGEFVVYKIDIPANRYDLLCMEGFARALRIFIGVESSPVRGAFVFYDVFFYKLIIYL